MSTGIGIGASYVFQQLVGDSFVINKVWNFDGVDEYIAFQNYVDSTAGLSNQPSGADVAADGFTVSFWVKSPSFANKPLWGNNQIGPGGTVYGGLLLNSHSSGSLVISQTQGAGGGIGSGNRKSALTQNELVDGQWNNVIVSYQGTPSTPNASAWINGVPTPLAFTVNPYGKTFNPGSYGGPLGYSNSERAGGFGVNSIGSLFFDGQMAELSYWNTTFDNANAAALYNAGKPIDITQDSGGYNKSSLLSGYWTTRNLPTWNENWYAWKDNRNINNQSNYSLSLNPSSVPPGSEPRYELGNGSGTEASIGIFDSDFSISGWFVCNNSIDIKMITCANDPSAGGVRGWEVYTTGTGINFKVYHSGLLATNVSQAFVPDVWNFFRITYKKGPTLTDVYQLIQVGQVGGSLAAPTAFTPSVFMDRTNGPFKVIAGANQNGATSYQKFFDGQLDDIAFYNQTLNTSQAESLFDRSETPQSLSAGCTAWWKFGDFLSYPDPTYSSNWHLVNAVADADTGIIITEDGTPVTAENGAQLIVEGGLESVDLIGANTSYYTYQNIDMTTKPLIGVAGVSTSTPQGSGNAFTINMEEGDLINEII